MAPRFPNLENWLLTVHYAALFFIGAALATHRAYVAKWIGERGTAARTALWLGAFGCLFMPPEFLRGWMVYVVGIGATLAVALSIGERALETPAALYLGKISYSLYLVHLPILLALMHLFYGAIATPALIAGGVAVTFLVADLSNRWIERPAQRLGRKLAG
jgi:peptidoglycan/LPS O-acetylase OafA/YrhL